MKKTAFKLISLALVMLMLLSGGAIQALAAPFSFSLPVSDSEWDAIWDKIDATNSSIALTPGSNETERNFAWQSAKNAVNPSVTLSKSADLSDAAVFTGRQALNKGTLMQTNYVKVTGLEANTVYYYKYSTTLDESEILSFETKAFDDFSVILCSDIHIESTEDGALTEKTSGKIWNSFLENALSRNPETAFIMAAGDNANVGAAREYLGLYSPPALQSIPMATCIGNHDKKAYNYEYYMNNPNNFTSLAGSIQGDEYWFRYGDVLFLVMDTTHGSGIDHYNFAKIACDANPDAKWRIVMYHHDLHGSSYDKTAEDKILQWIFDPIMSFIDADVVFSGHNHRYGRTHQMDNGKVVFDTTGMSKLLDPIGLTYIGTTSINHMADTPRGEVTNPEVVFAYNEPTMTYNVLTFEGNTFNMKLCRENDGAVLDEITIEKSEDNIPKTSEKNVGAYIFVMILSTIYSIFDKLADVIDIQKTFIK